jgi:hypothetical protein
MGSNLRRPRSRLVHSTAQAQVSTESDGEGSLCHRHDGAIIRFEDECPLCALDDSKSETETKLEEELSAANLRIAKLESDIEQSPKLEELKNYKKLVEKYQEENSELEQTIQELERKKELPSSPVAIESIPENKVVKSFVLQQEDEKVSSPVQQASTVQNPPEAVSLPPALQAVAEQFRAQMDNEDSQSMNLHNIWFLRVLLLGAGEIVAILLLTYSFIFISTFMQYANTTSYYPWNWQTVVTQSDVVWNQFYLGIGISIVALAGCMGAQFFIFEKKLKAKRLLTK